jgi:hypothetical protein
MRSLSPQWIRLTASLSLLFSVGQQEEQADIDHAQRRYASLMRSVG